MLSCDFDILGRAVQPEDLLAPADHRLRLREVVAEPRVPLPGDLAGEFEVLSLVFSDRDESRVVQQDVGRLQDRIVQKSGADDLRALRLVLELRHPAQLTQWRDRIEQPLELRVFRHRRLHEQDAILRIESGSEEADRHVEHALLQRLRLIRDRYGVQVHDRVDALVPFGQFDPVLDRAQVVAQMQIAGGLNTAEHAGFSWGHCGVVDWGGWSPNAGRRWLFNVAPKVAEYPEREQASTE